MKLSFSYDDLAHFFSTSLPDSDRIIESVVFDTRKIIQGESAIFFALKGDFRDGHDFIADAYQKGIRLFVVSQIPEVTLEEAHFIVVDDPLFALQELAKKHRETFNFPIIAITGSAGKTITKEWLSEVLRSEFRIVRSPKSYNSQLGVALSLFELNDEADLAIIEAGISHPGEMKRLEEMIQPTLGIFTSIGSAHQEHFESIEQKAAEKGVLFEHVQSLFMQANIPLENLPANTTKVHCNDYIRFFEALSFDDEISRTNASIVIAVAQELGIPEDIILERLKRVSRLAMRLETFDGIHNSLIINDTYNLDLDAFRSSLEYQLSISKGRERLAIIGASGDRNKLLKIIEEFEPIRTHFITSNQAPIPEFNNAVVLVKGERHLHLERYVNRLKEKKHQTFVEINLNAVKKNISLFKSRLPKSTKLLTMVKASSYGSGIEKMGAFLERIGVDYLGVAYVDEGVELRNVGIKLPILVMNTEPSAYEECIAHDLEPSIFSTEQLDGFVRHLIYEGKTNYPIHIKLETGMNRLGFNAEGLQELIDLLKSQPEVRVQSVYSHLAEADNSASDFTHQQAEKFEEMSQLLQSALNYTFDRHLLNSEGILNYPEYHYNMVRLGIGMYGYATSEAEELEFYPAIKWFSAISQIKSIHTGESIGYGRSFTAKAPMEIAIIPIGYADGFKRILSNGSGSMILHNQTAPVIGNVCMDMTMIDVSGIDAAPGDPVEIIGEHITLTEFSQKLNTIPYEVLASIPSRVARVYLED